MNEKEIRRYLAIVRRACSLIEEQLDDTNLEEVGANREMPKPAEPQFKKREPEDAQPQTAEQYEESSLARKDHIKRLLEIEEWPEAVPPYLVASDSSDQDQIDRANAVLDTMDVQGVRFLDFGCGEGWIAKQMLSRGAVESTGYDIKRSKTWKRLEGPKFTSNFNDVKRAYYDAVMLYDVLDHAENPEDVMKKVEMVLKKEGKVYVRCHPWTSVHANHIYKKGLNRAYIHLFLCWEEMHDLVGEDPMYTRTEKDPLNAYRWWFHDFRIKKERMVKEPVHEFFLQKSFKELLQSEQQLTDENLEPFMERMSIQFVDYLLARK